MRIPLCASVFMLGFSLLAQQVKFIDVTTITPRVELRYPPAPVQENGFGGGYGGMSVGDCGLDSRSTDSLAVSVESVIASDTYRQEPFEIEFQVLNTGLAPLHIPVSPHLADLQPDDPSAEFSYTSIALAVSPVEDRSSIGSIELYGKSDVPGTVVTLNPGEWLRVKAKVKFLTRVPPSGTVNLEPGFWLRRITVYPHPGGISKAADGICIKATHVPNVLVHRR